MLLLQWMAIRYWPSKGKGSLWAHNFTDDDHLCPTRELPMFYCSWSRLHSVHCESFDYFFFATITAMQIYPITVGRTDPTELSPGNVRCRVFSYANGTEHWSECPALASTQVCFEIVYLRAVVVEPVYTRQRRLQPDPQVLAGWYQYHQLSPLSVISRIVWSLTNPTCVHMKFMHNQYLAKT